MRLAHPGATIPERGVTTVGSLLAWARDRLKESQADAPWLTAIALLEHATGFGRAAVLAHPERRPSAAEATAFRDLVERRCASEPLAYLLGYREFYGRPFAVTRSTLIPRPETEGLVDLALRRIDRMAGTSAGQIVDVGTGSGAIAVTLLAERPRFTAIGIDCDPNALAVARANAVAHAVADRLQLIAGNLLDGLTGQVPLIVANLPYIPGAEIDALQPEIARYEPRLALDGGSDGLSLIAALLEQSRSVLAPSGALIAEIGDDQADRALELARSSFPADRLAVERDALGAQRFLVVDRAIAGQRS